MHFKKYLMIAMLTLTSFLALATTVIATEAKNPADSASSEAEQYIVIDDRIYRLVQDEPEYIVINGHIYQLVQDEAEGVTDSDTIVDDDKAANPPDSQDEVDMTDSDDAVSNNKVAKLGEVFGVICIFVIFIVAMFAIG